MEHALAAFWRGERVAVLSTLVRAARGDFERAEDALSAAIARAAERWPADGVPDRPGAWILVTARRTLVDAAREGARLDARALDDGIDAMQDADDCGADDCSAHEPHDPSRDDRLALLFTLCHPALSRAAGVTLALRTVGGLTTREIARALLEPEATTAQRLVRVRRKIRDARVPFRVPGETARLARADAVLETLYLVFNEGYGATDDDGYLRDGLAEEAIRLARLLVAVGPDDPESLGLLALMLLHHARRHARVIDGAIVPLETQDRSRWDATAIREGERLLDQAIARGRAGPYQLQAAIAALHATATSAERTDWRQIAILYGALRFHLPTPVVELNAAVALAMVHGPDWGLAQLDVLEQERGMRDYHLLPAARADLLRRAGRYAEAARSYEIARDLARSAPEQRYLERRLTEARAATLR